LNASSASRKSDRGGAVIARFSGGKAPPVN